MLPSTDPRPEAIRAQGAEMLRGLVLQGLALSLFVQRAHWAVRGPSFLPFHRLFGEVYDGLGEVLDTLAECAAALGAADPMGDATTVPVSSLNGRSVRPILDGLALSGMIAEGIADFLKAVYDAYGRAEEMGLVADANALQSAAEGIRKLGWMVRSHTIAS